MGEAIFVYGTLLDPRVFARFAGRTPPLRAVPARLSGHRRVHLRGTPWPTLLPGQGEVAGLLMPRLAPDAMRRLRAYEGACYRLSRVRVVTARGARMARAWIAPRWLADPRRDWVAPR
ncbi:gamma-glutamylcyclotransferase family protein [Falsiroseomonas sp. HW251]|uniref:gamma-glutamylcyclotransferase family protein n=1 Tax=Falsiroseomonas sp. HW251 TaxID=3390998 RepID=UPI003D319450